MERRLRHVSLLIASTLAAGMALNASADSSPTPAPAATVKTASDWLPELSPHGPLLIVVSLPDQRADVYRNGVRIASSAVSTGKPGHETPTGVFTILQKHRDHYSNLYDNAPMPFMQRLTWDGIALHAGKLPGYPASHGCVRLPDEFSERLFGITERGMTVIITNDSAPAPTVVHPGLFDAIASNQGPPVAADFSWKPELSPDGPLTVVLSTRDLRVVVLRNGRIIGQAPIRWRGGAPSGTRAYLLLEGARADASSIVAGRPALRWMSVPGHGGGEDEGLHRAARDGDVSLPPAFAQHVYDALEPGATVVVTDEALSAGGGQPPLTILRADEAP